MINGNKLGEVGFEKLGTPYSEMDCQRFVEWCISKCGVNIDLRGSNALYRYVIEHGWVGTPEECIEKFGNVPKGAFLFILAFDGGEVSKGYNDGLGNASHIGICTMPKGEGAIHSSSSRGGVCESKFQGRTIKNGGWNRVGLWLEKVEYNTEKDPADDPSEPVVETAIVHADNGYPVKMRAKPSRLCRTYWEVPVGSEVVLMGTNGSWSEIIWNGRTGYMMTKFLIIGNATYTVIIPNRTAQEADELIEKYDGAYKEVEKG